MKSHELGWEDKYRLFDEVHSTTPHHRTVVNYDKIDRLWVHQIVDYTLFGIIPSDPYVYCVLINDIFELTERTIRSGKYKDIKPLAEWILNYVPAAAFGGQEEIEAWQKCGGCVGLSWQRNRLKSA